jgi:hypothetical protein
MHEIFRVLLHCTMYKKEKLVLTDVRVNVEKKSPHTKLFKSLYNIHRFANRERNSVQRSR